MRPFLASCFLHVAAAAAGQLYPQDAAVTSAPSSTGPSIRTLTPSSASTAAFPLRNSTWTTTTATTTCSTSTSTASTMLYKSVHSPSGCFRANVGVTYVTETVTQTDTITVAPSLAHIYNGPELYMPTPPCPQPQSYGASSASAPICQDCTTPLAPPEMSSVAQTTKTIRATVKTRQIITDSNPPVTFGKPPTHTPPPTQDVPDSDNQSVDVGRVITSAFGFGGRPAGGSGSGGAGGPANNAGSGGSPAVVPGPGVKVNHVPVSIGPNGVAIGGSSFPAGQPTAAVHTVGGQTFTILPSASGVVVPGGMTLTATSGGATGLPVPEYTATTVDGIPLDVGQSQAVIDGTTVHIGPGAATSTLVVDGETITVGPFGVGFPSTTLAPYAGDGTFTADGSLFSFGLGDVIIDGSTYALSKPTDVVVGSETVSVGTFGVGLASTTVAPPAATTSSSGQDTLQRPLLLCGVPFLLALW